MTNFKDLPFQSLQFYATAPYACSYLDDRQARSQVATPPQFIRSKIYDQLITAGFRRSGLFTYRPYCDGCQACIATRIPVKDFEPNRSQSRAWKKHQHLEAHVLPLDFNPEHYKLYQSYQSTRHQPINEGGQNNDTSEDEEDQYRQFLLQTNIESVLVEFRENHELRMVSIIDVLSDGLSSVYTFYDTSVKQNSYGVYGILWQIEQAKKLGMHFVYLGYYIEQSQKMSYKSQFRPLEGLVNNQWSILFKK
jgi:arginyl-tRNA--protein-N-Asp/Glu arginylyltransferase